MGGIATAANVASAGLTAKNILDERTSTKISQRNIRSQQYNNSQNGRNLLDEQLAARRARMSAMGIDTSGSSEAVQQKMIDDYYQAQAASGQNADESYEALEINRKKGIQNRALTGAVSSFNKLIK